MVDGRWSMVDGRWSMVDGRWSMVDGEFITVLASRLPMIAPAALGSYHRPSTID